MADEPLREIQLNGKQLVFLFMAATVVAVVIFLSGVLVGRESPRGEATLAAASGEEIPAVVAELAAIPLAATSSNGGPVAADEGLTYPRYLDASAPPPEVLAEPLAEARPEEAAPVAAAPPPEPAPAADAPLAEPAGDGFVVQVAAVSGRDEAEAIADSLSAKGYPAFVTTPGAGGPAVFRVRVGKYPDRREAESVAGRLEREEQFKPWITR